MRKVVIAALLSASSTAAVAGWYRQSGTSIAGPEAFISVSDTWLGWAMFPRDEIIEVRAKAAIVNPGDFDNQVFWWSIRVYSEKDKKLPEVEHCRADAFRVGRGTSVVHFDRNIPKPRGKWTVSIALHVATIHGDNDDVNGGTLDSQSWRVEVR
jgi:hypothetical protein